MTKKTRLLAAILALAAVLVVLFSAFVFVKCADHDCIGEGCKVCYMTSVCVNTLKTLSRSLAFVAAAVLFCFLAITRADSEKSSTVPFSLVSLNVKLSN